MHMQGENKNPWKRGRQVSHTRVKRPVRQVQLRLLLSAEPPKRMDIPQFSPQVEAVDFMSQFCKDESWQELLEVSDVSVCVVATREIKFVVICSIGCNGIGFLGWFVSDT